MAFYNFNPFNKDINQITSEDLYILRDVSEGWYLDYKEKSIDIKSIAKHMSAFANQYGGWLFFGVKESPEKTAESFPGIEHKDIGKLSTAIREAISAHVNPEVYYEEKVIHGPSEKIGLSDSRAIYVIYIPEGKRPPYIHSSGKIYRRVADHSDPKAETDRYVLDKLWEKSQKNNKNFEKFLSNRPHYHDINTPIAYIHLFTDPYFIKRFDRLKFDDFKNSLIGIKDGKPKIPMNTFYSAHRGYIARQTKHNNPLLPVLSFRWWHSGTALLIIPFNSYSNDRLIEEYKSSDNPLSFIKEKKKHDLGSTENCDLNYFFSVLAGLYNQFLELKNITNNDGEICASIKIVNTFNVIPFIDDSEYIKRVVKYGIPLVFDEDIIIPEVRQPEFLIKIDSEDTKTDADVLDAFVKVGLLAAYVLSAFGCVGAPEEIVKYKSLLGPSKDKKYIT